MDKEVVVTADVDEEEKLLYKVFKFVNLLWLYGLILGETLEEARKISSDQGCHEHEVSFNGEADLHRHYLRCEKNPGHRQFIPVRDFKIDHLPLSHRDNLVYDWIRAAANLTCRLLVRYTSGNRPKYHPIRKHLRYPFSKVRGDFIRTGTGYVNKLFKYTEVDNKNCECDECKRPGTHTPHKVWGKVRICTAVHMVYDNDEARSTTCYFGYDTSTTLLPNCLKLTGLRVEESIDVDDVCSLTYITHDMDVINKLDGMFRHRQYIQGQLVVNYGESKTTSVPAPGPIVIISHPHGCSKHITVGMWTERQTITETFKHKGETLEADMVMTIYTYDTHTCPGSSGAPAFKLPEKGRSETMLAHYHSEGGEKNTNNNKSVAGPEFVSPPTPLRTN